MSIAASLAIHTGQLAAQMIMLKPRRGIFPTNITIPAILAQAVIEERHLDRMEITSHPIEQGAAISDHAFANPSEVILTLGWSNSGPMSQKEEAASILASWASTEGGKVGAITGAAVGAAQAANNLLAVSNTDRVVEAYDAIMNLYYTRTLFTLYTAKRIYNNMLCRLVATETDAESPNALFITVECQQILIVDTNLIQLSSEKQKSPEVTSPPTSVGPRQMTPL
jgi:hypothetical protein